jgi:hypothetical protein
MSDGSLNLVKHDPDSNNDAFNNDAFNNVGPTSSTGKNSEINSMEIAIALPNP